MSVSALQSPPVDLSSPNALEAAIRFPQGLVGCEAWKSFVLLVSDEEDLPVATLQSLEDHDVSLLVADPNAILTDYTVRLAHSDREFLELEPGVDPVLLTTLTLTQDGWLTANLLGPLAINPRNRRGKQIVLADSLYSTRHPVCRMDAADDEA